MLSTHRKIFLLGNPNVGKSSIFNHFTGLHQKISNFPGVTVDKKRGYISLSNGEKIELIDLPGAYSLHATSTEEYIVLQELLKANQPANKNTILYVIDATNIERHLLLLSQLISLEYPVIVCITMHDTLLSKEFNIEPLSAALGLPIFLVNGRTGEGLNAIKAYLSKNEKGVVTQSFLNGYTATDKKILHTVQEKLQVENSYAAELTLLHFPRLSFLTEAHKLFLQNLSKEQNIKSLPLQISDTLKRFDKISPLSDAVIGKTATTGSNSRIDSYLTHPFWGIIIFLGLLFFIFESIFSVAAYPMDAIETLFNQAAISLNLILPDHILSSLLIDGLLAGLGGIVVFVPQIAILFLLIGLLEESGYMARAVYLSDSLMKRFGLNGRSLVSLFSGMACAIPAVMSARTITNQRERLLTILVTPLMSCSARIPVYVILIAILIPSEQKLGIFNIQGLMMFGLYTMGIVAALGISALIKPFIPSQEISYLVLELPSYKVPYWRNVLIGVWNKVKSFLVDAGKIILIISVVIWVLGNFGPTNAMQAAEDKARILYANDENIENKIAEVRLENSYLGHLGKSIEPAIRPLGFDWKIGIALLSSFAAREVFVGTMATIYSVGAEDTDKLRTKMQNATYMDTGKKVFTPATTLSLLFFYVFAMQCMSTLAVVKRETNSWKWAIFQLLYMSILAYTVSFLTYQFCK